MFVSRTKLNEIIKESSTDDLMKMKRDCDVNDRAYSVETIVNFILSSVLFMFGLLFKSEIVRLGLPAGIFAVAAITTLALLHHNNMVMSMVNNEINNRK